MDTVIKGLSIIKQEAESLQTGSGVFSSSDQASREKKQKLLAEIKAEFESLQKDPLQQELPLEDVKPESSVEG